MARKVDVAGLRRNSLTEIDRVMLRLERAVENCDYLVMRWMAQMSAVEIHAIWERYVEKRLVGALNHDAAHFLKEQEIKGVDQVSVGLASYIIRSGARFFDFRSTSDLLSKSDGWLAQSHNPFRKLSVDERKYIDLLAAVRNYVVHQSDFAKARYKKQLKDVYGIKSAPEPDEFLYAKDLRPQGSPAKGQIRLEGIVIMVKSAINR